MTTDLVKVDKEIMGGTPCFNGTRVPVEMFFKNLAAGYNVDYFAYLFPTVKKQQLLDLLAFVTKAAEEAAMVVDEPVASGR